MKHQCITTTNNDVLLKEAGKKVLVKNSDKLSIKKITYDGCEVKNLKGVDYICRIDPDTDILIELKGADIYHAIQQINNTLHTLTKKNDLLSNRIGVLKCRQVPKAGRHILKSREKLLRSFKCKVEISSSSSIFCAKRLKFI